MDTAETTASEVPAAPIGDQIARPARYYRFTRFLVTIALIGYGAWSIYDGFVKWPGENADYIRRHIDVPAHTQMDIAFNKVLGILLPPAGIALLCWTLYQSPGQYRLIGDTISVPGHPPVPLEQIDSIDKEKWSRKGIAAITYRLNSGQTGTFLLDDFVYEQKPTDAIFKRIEESLLAAPPPEAPAIPTPPPAIAPMRIPPRPRL